MSSVHRSFTLIAAVAAIAVLVPFVAFRSGGASPEGSSGRTAPGEADVWFAPFPKGLPAPAWQDGYGATDFMALFQPGADWEAAASRTNVFKFYVQWVLSASEPDLRLAVGALNQRGISIAVETAGLTTGECGANTEGFLPHATGVALAVARRIRSAGGTLSYLTFDEPLTFAPGACGWTASRGGSTPESVLVRIFWCLVNRVHRSDRKSQFF